MKNLPNIISGYSQFVSKDKDFHKLSKALQYFAFELYYLYGIPSEYKSDELYGDHLVFELPEGYEAIAHMENDFQILINVDFMYEGSVRKLMGDVNDCLIEMYGDEAYSLKALIPYHSRIKFSAHIKIVKAKIDQLNRVAGNVIEY